MDKNESLDTGSLLNDIKNASDIKHYLHQFESGFIKTSIVSFFEEMMSKYKVSKSDIIRRADIDRGYGYQILKGTRNAGRDNYLRIAIGMGLDLPDTQLLLNITETSPLYVKIKRDAAIIYCIEKHFTLIETQEILYQLNLKILA